MSFYNAAKGNLAEVLRQIELEARKAAKTDSVDDFDYWRHIRAVFPDQVEEYKGVELGFPKETNHAMRTQGAELEMSVEEVKNSNTIARLQEVKVYVRNEGSEVEKEFRKANAYYQLRHDLLESRLTGETKVAFQEVSKTKEFRERLDSLTFGWQRTNFLLSSIHRRLERTSRKQFTSKWESLAMKPSQSLLQYYQYIMEVGEGLAAVGREKSESEIKEKFLQTITPSYALLASDIDEEDHTILEIITKVEAKAKRRREITERIKKRKIDESTQYRSQKFLKKRGKCQYCGKRGHVSEECWDKPKDDVKSKGDLTGPKSFVGSSQQKDRKDVKCYNCGEMGHIAPNCKKPKDNRNIYQ